MGRQSAARRGGGEQQVRSVLLSASQLFPRMLSSASANCSFDVIGILALQISPGSTAGAAAAPGSPVPVATAAGARGSQPAETAIPTKKHTPKPTDSLLSRGFS